MSMQHCTQSFMRGGDGLPPNGVIGVDPWPLEVKMVRRISPDGLLVKWTPPESMAITGYELFVNDELNAKISSPNRTSTILEPLNFENNLIISVYALTRAGKCTPPATAIFEVD